MKFESETLGIDINFVARCHTIDLLLQLPVIRSLMIHNYSGSDIQQCKIIFKGHGACTIPPQIIDVETLYAHKPTLIQDAHLDIAVSELDKIIDPSTLYLDINILQGLNTIFSVTLNIEVWPPYSWLGIHQPTHALVGIAQHYQQAIPSLFEHLNGLKNAKIAQASKLNTQILHEVIAYIFDSIKALNITFSLLNQAYIDQGGGIRSITNILNEKTANSLEISLLLHTTLEHLHIPSALLVINKQVMCLIPHQEGLLEHLDSISADDLLLQLKHQVNNYQLIDTTGLCKGLETDPHVADQMGKSLLFNELITNEEVAYINIKQQALHLSTIGNETHFHQYLSLTSVQQTASDKLNLWKNKLLDLSLSNSLLNINKRRSQIVFRGTFMEHILNELFGKQSLSLLPEYILDHEGNKLSDHHLNLINKLFKKSQNNLEESGANTLYIGIGILNWKEENSAVVYQAPLLLLPVTIQKGTNVRAFSLNTTAESIEVNETLLLFLQRRFQCNINLNIEEIINFQQVVNYINNIQGQIPTEWNWRIDPTAILANFSYNNFLLWNDLRQHQQEIKDHKLIKSIITGQLQWQPDKMMHLNQIDYDRFIRPGDLMLPLPTDSTQLGAVLSAHDGESFVLEGPPGTGKSQTITNIIANALYHKKRVLFVAAKQTALSIVKERLHKIGIGNFALQITEGADKKATILNQLSNACLMTNRKQPDDFQTAANKLYQERLHLQDTIQAIHKPQKFGLSLYQLIERYNQTEADLPIIPIPTNALQHLDKAQFLEWERLSQKVNYALQAYGTYTSHPLSHLVIKEYSGDIRQQIQSLLSNLNKDIQELITLTNHVAESFQLKHFTTTVSEFEKVEQLIKLWVRVDDFPNDILNQDTNKGFYNTIIQFAEIGLDVDRLKKEILLDNHEAILEIDAQNILTDWHEAINKWMLPRWRGIKSIVKQIRKTAQNQYIEVSDIPDLLKKIINFQQQRQILRDNDATLKRLGHHYQDNNTDWNLIIRNAHLFIAINERAKSVVPAKVIAHWRKQMNVACVKGTGDFVKYHEQLWNNWITLYHKYQSDIAQIAPYFNTPDLVTATLQDNKKAIHDTYQQIHLLKNWYQWSALKTEAEKYQFDFLFKYLEEYDIPKDEFQFIIDKSIYQALIEYIIDQSVVLKQFKGKIFEQEITFHRLQAKRFEELTQQTIKAALSARVPSISHAAANSSEMGILQKAIRNKGRGITIRQLFQQTPDLVNTLSPCMMMSPTSVIEYFPTLEKQFDLVIFDEASQLPTYLTISALARAPQAIIVGDSKQMPPSHFFQNGPFTPTNIWEDDMDNILEEYLAVGIPSKQLQWHYRSHHESLIAFSNQYYYQQQLHTFPSADYQVEKLAAITLNGIYDRAKTRQNYTEAIAIVEEIINRLQHPTTQHQSIGVITLSLPQQLLISQLLDTALSKQTHLQEIISKQKESIFIKNLENVQGDERDVILLSIGYGPDKEGFFTHNFGALNKLGGERRLNVAITRARQLMKIYKSFYSEDIDLSRTSSKGLADLKSYLHYAENKVKLVPLQAKHNEIVVNKNDSLLLEIADELTANNYKFDLSVGAGACKIDIAIKHPQNQDQYMLGIQLDNPAYAKLKTIQDKEIIQPQILEMLGWKLHRIWTIDWWEDKELTLKTLLSKLSMLSLQSIQDKNTLITPINSVNTHLAQEEILPVVIEEFTYQAAVLNKIQRQGVDAFLSHTNRELVKRSIIKIMQQEAPITLDLLTKRLLVQWGIVRQGSRIEQQITTILSELNYSATNVDDQTIYWTSSQNPLKYTLYRKAGDYREWNEIPKIEIKNALMTIIEEQSGLTRDDLYQLIKSIFRFPRLSNNVITILDQLLKEGVEKKLVYLERDKVFFKQSLKEVNNF